MEEQLQVWSKTSVSHLVGVVWRLYEANAPCEILQLSPTVHDGGGPFEHLHLAFY